MLTVKQIEAAYWIATLGSFEAAARKLHTSQTAISKRIQELETGFGVPIFDRSRRTARLTAKGEEVVRLGRDLLDARNRIVDCLNGQEREARRLHFGITELTAQTWLPAFVQAMRARYPNVTLAPTVDTSVNLLGRLSDSSIELIVTPDFPQDAAIAKVPLQQVMNAWMCHPDLLDTSRLVPLAEIARYPLLTLGPMSFTSSAVIRWFEAHNVAPGDCMSSNSNVALCGLAVSGLGLAYLPLHYFHDLVDTGLLAVVRSTPRLPKIRYVAAYRNDGPTRFYDAVAQLARRCCDFSARSTSAQMRRPRGG
ncbi:HTH-type transcriptional activator CmpR [Pigmentiphaga humi]|uniref:HTH-type transcriptional activator CmpR n=1 Tax=Pigmentiphaga humi TaxID=2478468 RepID=A0A3P4B5X8_9BURK|nr:LysR family transcriptional regulator [Pigmentiphaga humi]VCU71462.1 HTH-type transcriptional activator CmpR [Pigmentiphaga humi]